MKVIGKTFAVLYTILFTLFTFVLVLVFTVSGYFKGNFYTNLITSDAFMKTKLSSLNLNFDGKEEIMEICGSENCTVEDAVIKGASNEFGIEEKLVKKALNDKDIQKALGDFIGVFIAFETTGTSPKLNYKTYEKALNKEVSKKILKQLDITNKDVKKAIDEYNNQIDNNQNYKGGMLSEQSAISLY